MTALSLSTSPRLVLPHWFDSHAHFREGVVVARLLADHAAMGCDAVLAMPNTSLPVAKVYKADIGDFRSTEDYQRELWENCAANIHHILTPLYVTPFTDAKMVVAHAKNGGRSLKYYPPHGTTNSEYGLGIRHLIGGDVFRAMEDEGMILNIHGERHGLTGEAYFGQFTSAEQIFYEQEMAALVRQHPNLRIVCEHISTAAAVRFVTLAGPNVCASITPQHPFFVAGDVLQNWWSHVKCMPLVKFEADRQALVGAMTAASNTKFFAGTDSAPHPQDKKESDCGCASGCYTGGIAPQLYAMIFERAGVDLVTPEGQRRFRAFLCGNGRDCYDLPPAAGAFELIREPQTTPPVTVPGYGQLVNLNAGIVAAPLRNAVTLPWRIGRTDLPKLQLAA